jgi:hypothetical protein
VDSRLIILGMLLLAVGAAVLGIGYLRGLSQRAQAYWEPAHAELILQAPHVEAWQLAGAERSGTDAGVEQVTIDGRSVVVLARRDVSEARGLVNVRRGLMQDASYDWDTPPTLPSDWDYALRFHDGDRETVLLFSLVSAQAARAGLQPIATRPINQGLEAFFAEQF